MNKVLLTGRLTRDPELRYTSYNKAVCNFTIATNRPVVRDGEKIADFINCIVWGKTAENLSKYQSKGSLIGIDGRLESRSYDDKDGNKRYVTEVQVEHIEFLGSKSDGQTETKESNPYEEFGNAIEISDDELPF